MAPYETDDTKVTESPARREYAKPRLQVVPMQEAMGAAGFTPSSHS